MFAALNTVEPPIMDLSFVDNFEADKPWSEPRRPSVEGRVRARLSDTAARLGDAEWLHGAFRAGDVLMIAVLRSVSDGPLLAVHDTLVRYVARCEARPAFRKALADQVAGFTGDPPAGFRERRHEHGRG